jgi:hypothetical protein
MIIFGLLAFVCCVGLLNLFVIQNYIKKVFSLAVVYSSFLVLIILLSLKKDQANEISSVVFSMFFIFSTNLLVGIGLVKNINDSKTN